MRHLLAFVLLCIGYSSASQTKEHSLFTYFLGIPVRDSFGSSLLFLKTSPRFGVDSVQQGGRVFSSVKDSVPFAEQGVEKIVVLAHRQVWQDSVTGELYDTASIISVEYFFNKNDEKGRNNFYKLLRKEFIRYYPYTHERKLSGIYDATLTQLAKGQFDNYPELSIYKGNLKDSFHYVTVRYDRRKYHQVREPEVSIRVLSF